MKFEKIVKFSPAFDKRSDKPGENYGICSMRMWFILKGRHGAVQVCLNTPFYLPETVDDYRRIGNKNKTTPSDIRDENGKARGFDCWDVGFHSKKKPDYMNKSDKGDCDIIGKCYYDGSSLRGKTDGIGDMFMKEGEEPVWEYLEKYYKEKFVNDVEDGKK